MTYTLTGACFPGVVVAGGALVNANTSAAVPCHRALAA